jgi:REP-associated tyrosine transposase
VVRPQDSACDERILLVAPDLPLCLGTYLRASRIMQRLGRRSTRLAAYDYRRPGAYFVTICTWRRGHLFGEVVDGRMRLSVAGKAVEEEWLRTGRLRAGLDLDSFVVMPNHLHGIILFQGPANPEQDSVSQGTYVSRSPGSLGSVVAGFKQAVTLRLRRREGVNLHRVWQRNYYEHVIRNELELNKVRRYIDENPLRWARGRTAVRPYLIAHAFPNTRRSNPVCPTW